MFISSSAKNSTFVFAVTWNIFYHLFAERAHYRETLQLLASLAGQLVFYDCSAATMGQVGVAVGAEVVRIVVHVVLRMGTQGQQGDDAADEA